MNTVHTNAGGAANTQVSLNDSDVRAMANISSGAISMNDCRGGTTITQGGQIPGSAGYSEGIGTGSAFGSIADDDIFVTGRVMGIFYTEISFKGTTSRTFFVYISGNRAQNAFTSAYESSIGTLATSSASHSYNSQYNYTVWSWNLASSPSNWNGSGALKVKLNP
jgi:hypothetical protein